MVEFKILRATRGIDSKLTTLTFRRGNLTFSTIYLVQSHGMRFYREEGPNKADSFLGITSSKLNSNEAQ